MTSSCPAASMAGRLVSRAAASTAPSVDALPAQQQLAARDARHVEQVVDQARHVGDLALDHVAAPGPVGLGRAFAPEDRDRGADRRERVAQLVRQRGDELVLAAVGLAQRFLGGALLGHVHGDRTDVAPAGGVAQRELHAAQRALALRRRQPEVVEPRRAVLEHRAVVVADVAAARPGISSSSVLPSQSVLPTRRSPARFMNK